MMSRHSDFLSYGLWAAPQNGHRADDAGQRVADLVGQASRQLPDGVEALGTLHTLEVVLELLIDLGQLPGSALQVLPLLPLALNQDAGQQAGRTEQGDLENLGQSVAVQRAPGHQDVRRLTEAGEERGAHAPAPAKTERGVYDRKVVQMLEDIVPVGLRERGGMVQMATDRIAAAVAAPRRSTLAFRFNIHALCTAETKPYSQSTGILRGQPCQAVYHMGQLSPGTYTRRTG